MATKLIETCAGSAALEARAADTGGPNWVKTLGPTLTCDGTGRAVSGTPNSDSEYHFAVNAGTADATAVFDFYLNVLDGTSYTSGKLREQTDGSAYIFSVAGNGNVLLYHRASGGGYTLLTTLASGVVTANWCRLQVAVNSGFLFTVSLWNSSNEGDLGSGPALVVNAATYTDSGSNIAAAGRTGFQARNAVLSYASLVDSAAAGAAFAGAITNDDATVSGSFSSQPPSSFLGALVGDDATVSGAFGAASGTFVSPPLKTNNGTVLVSTALAYVAAYHATTRALVAVFTGLSTDAEGRFTVSSVSLPVGTPLRWDWETAGGERRMPLGTPS